MKLRHKKGSFNCLTALSLLFFFSLLAFTLPGVCSALQRCHNQDGCEQSGHGDGPQLPPMPFWRSADHLWKHTQGDVLPENAHRSLRHQFYWRGGVNAVNTHSRYTFTIIRKHCLCYSFTGNCQGGKFHLLKQKDEKKTWTFNILSSFLGVRQDVLP